MDGAGDADGSHGAAMGYAALKRGTRSELWKQGSVAVQQMKARQHAVSEVKRTFKRSGRLSSEHVQLRGWQQTPWEGRA